MWQASQIMQQNHDSRKQMWPAIPNFHYWQANIAAKGMLQSKRNLLLSSVAPFPVQKFNFFQLNVYIYLRIYLEQDLVKVRYVIAIYYSNNMNIFSSWHHIIELSKNIFNFHLW